MNTLSLPDHVYRGARAMILLHEKELRAFVAIWKKAEAAGLDLPTSEDPDYASRSALLLHVLGAARHYMILLCKHLDLPAPEIPLPPVADLLAAAPEVYVNQVVEGWKTPLAAVPEERFFDEGYLTSWGARYCADAMIEHAVMHPLRHRFQLEELMSGR